MKTTISSAAFVAALLLLAVGEARAASPVLTGTRPSKDSSPESGTSASGTMEDEGGDRLVGDTIEQPFPVSGIPFSDTLATCMFADDYDEACPYGPSISPDVVYAFTPTYDVMVFIDLCLSSYDTKVYVYENSYTPGSPYACSDDYCAYQSKIPSVELLAGNTYYVVVDGYGGDCGEYVLDIVENLPCVMECPPGAIAEGEPICQNNYVDSYNGGCGSHPESFFTLEPSGLPIEVCGESGTFLYNSMDMRDTDWYEITPAETTYLNLCFKAEFPASIGIIDGNEWCGGMYLRKIAYSDYCETACVSDTLPPGLYWLWVAPYAWTGVDCGSQYLMTVEGYHTSIATSVPGGGAPPVASLSPVAPNPFNPSAAIRFTLTAPAPIRLSVYDGSGRLVALLAEGSHGVGEFETLWDGTDRSGRPVGPGVYFVHLDAGPQRETRKAVLLK